jgi:hypothetical protein
LDFWDDPPLPPVFPELWIPKGLFVMQLETARSKGVAGYTPARDTRIAKVKKSGALKRKQKQELGDVHRLGKVRRSNVAPLQRIQRQGVVVGLIGEKIPGHRIAASS